MPSCTKEERKKKKKNLLFADLPESADVRGLQVFYTLPDRPQHLAFPSEKAWPVNSCFYQVGQGGPGSRPLTKLGSASSTRSRHKKEPLPMKLRSLPQSFWQQVVQHWKRARLAPTSDTKTEGLNDTWQLSSKVKHYFITFCCSPMWKTPFHLEQSTAPCHPCLGRWGWSTYSTWILVILIKLLNLVEFYCLAWLTWRDLYTASDICPSFSIGHLREPLGNGQTMCLHLPRWNSLNFLLSTLETIKHWAVRHTSLFLLYKILYTMK